MDRSAKTVISRNAMNSLKKDPRNVGQKFGGKEVKPEFSSLNNCKNLNISTKNWLLFELGHANTFSERKPAWIAQKVINNLYLKIQHHEITFTPTTEQLNIIKNWLIEEKKLQVRNSIATGT